jgi:hypothetical protein
VNSSGGYLGIQTGSISNGTVSTQVRFSIWNTNESETDTEAAQCVSFDGEGTGQSCFIPDFPVDFGVFYTLAIERIGEADAGKVWWQATVTNDSTCETTVLGRIRASHSGAPYHVRANENFSEYWGSRALDCNSVPLSMVEWQAPAVTSGATTVPVSFSRFHKAADVHTDCQNEGAAAHGEVLQDGGRTLYRMVNGSVQMCE